MSRRRREPSAIMSGIWEALESTAMVPDARSMRNHVTASAYSVRLYRDSLMRFLEDMDAEISVGEIREALEEYQFTT